MIYSDAGNVANPEPNSAQKLWIPAFAGMTVVYGKSSVIPAQVGIQNLKPGEATEPIRNPIEQTRTSSNPTPTPPYDAAPDTPPA